MAPKDASISSLSTLVLASWKAKTARGIFTICSQEIFPSIDTIKIDYDNDQHENDWNDVE